MSNTKTVMGQAANTLTVPLNVEDVFSTYLYTGNGSTQTITNGIDLDGEGGLVWLKNRDAATNHRLYTTDLYSGSNSNLLQTNLTTGGGNTGAFELESFNSNGFTLGYSGGAYSESNGANTDYASWTFRKAPKFFDVGTISFDGSGVGSYSHNLGSVPGMVILKLTNTTGDWFVWHKDLTSQNYAMFLNATAASSNQGGWATYTDTAVSFDSSVFANDTAVVYVFAHNDGDGGFNGGDIIKCGSYTGTGTEVDVNLGFEPQWILTRRADDPDDWYMVDTMRGIVTAGDDAYLRANLASAEGTGVDIFDVTATGFKTKVSSRHTNGGNYIYIAIRRGTKVPESATEVFGSSQDPIPTFDFPPDATLILDTAGGTSYHDKVTDRLRGSGNTLITNSTAAEVDEAQQYYDFNLFGNQNTFGFGWGGPQFTVHGWKRAPKFFDAVAYTGDGTGVRTVSHNLTVAPDMLWLKRRDGSSPYGDWYVQTTGIAATNYLLLNDTQAQTGSPDAWGSTYAASEVFTVGPDNNVSGFKYIVYLFASLPGISKVGSYTADGNAQNIDCGFTSGARFVLIKRTDTGGNWFVLDTERGIVAGNDPLLELNSTGAEDSQYDNLDPYSAGFTVAAYGGTSPYLNISGGSYIFYAIA